MRSLLLGLPLLMVAAVFQSTTLTQWRFPTGGGWDIILILTLAWTIAGDWQGGLLWGFVGGLSLDLLSGGPLGAHALALTLMAFLASLSEGQLWRSHILLPLALGLLGSFGYHLVLVACLLILRYPLDVAQSVVGIILPSALVNTLSILPVYYGMRWLHGFIYPSQVKR